MLKHESSVFSCYTETCTHCMICFNTCPTESIRFDEEAGFTFLPGCTACMRCYNFCPTYLIIKNLIKRHYTLISKYCQINPH
ncbi:4Fe-4S binding protein [Acetobacterium tundrae]|uniref:4Fe-4S binding protein n=1 Tax=Acetobacterium tundrae TaxID=132932 RepID=UPI00164A1E39